MQSTNSIPTELGDFEIIRQLGRGGMGVVYEAQQKSLNRRVALKVLSSGLGLTTKAVMRFRREAEAAAKSAKELFDGFGQLSEEAESRLAYAGAGEPRISLDIKASKDHAAKIQA